MNKEHLKEVGTSSIYEMNDNLMEITSVISNLDDIYFEQVNCTVVYRCKLVSLHIKFRCKSLLSTLAIYNHFYLDILNV